MEFNLSKKSFSAERIKPVLLNLLNNLLVPFFNVLVSVFVVRVFSVQFWGEYSRAILFVAVLTQLSLWGSKDFLLREFSKKPHQVMNIWQQAITSRNLLTLVCAVLLFFILPGLTLGLTAAGILVIRSYYLSYEPVIAYTRQFLSKTVAEISGNVVLCTLIILYRDVLSLERFVFLALVAECVKLFFMLYRFRSSYALPWRLRFDAGYLRASAGFLLLSFSGFLIYKTDQLFAAAYFDAAHFGSYQLLMSFLLVVHAFAGYILQPSLKMLYRSKTQVVFRMASRLFIHGLWISLAAILFIRFVLAYFYKIEIGSMTFLAAYLFLIPTFYYSPLLYYCFSLQKETYVIAMNLCGAAVTFLGCIVLKHQVQEPLTAILVAAAVSQWLMCGAYVWTIRNHPAHTYSKERP